MHFSKQRCDKHGYHYFVSTSPGLAKAISSKRAVAREEIRHLQFDFDKRNLDYVVDCAFLEKLGMPLDQAVVVLKDRNTEMKQLNDRLLILQAMKALERVCPVCLDGLIAPSEGNPAS